MDAPLRSTASSPLLRRPDGAGLAAQIAVALAVVLTVNGVIAVVPGASEDDRPRSALLPPGAVVGTVRGVAAWALAVVRRADPGAAAVAAVLAWLAYATAGQADTLLRG